MPTRSDTDPDTDDDDDDDDADMVREILGVTESL